MGVSHGSGSGGSSIGTASRGSGVRPFAVVAVALAGVAALTNAAGLLFLDFFGGLIVMPLALGTFAAVGLIVALRRPDHPVGWLFLVAGVFYAVTLTLTAYSWRALVATPAGLPAGEIAAWLTSWLWLFATGATLVAVALFPDGRPPSARWRPLIGLMAAVLSLTVVAAAFAPTPLYLPVAMTNGPGAAGGGTIPNPFAVGGPLGEALLVLNSLTQASAVPMFVAVLAAVVVRFRRSTGIERQQLKWFAFAAAAAIAALAASFTLPAGPVADIAWAAGVLSFGLVPVGAGIAILRYRLYDIDVVIRRTLVYGVVVAILAAVYVALVLVLQAALSQVTGGGPLPVALGTLVIAALFGPVRARVRDVVDRRFYRARYSAQRTLETFGAQLRDEVELEAVARRLVEVTDSTVRPTSTSVWLRTGGAR